MSPKGWVLASLVLVLGSPRAACVTCGSTPDVSAPTDRYGDGDSQRQQEQHQWELAQPTGAGTRPTVVAPSPVLIGGAAVTGLVAVAGVGGALMNGGDGGRPSTFTRDEASPATRPASP
jgi:hypothetical protein